MKTKIVRAVARGRWYGGTTLFKDTLESLFESLREVHRNRDLPSPLRTWALEQMLKLKPVMGGSFSNTFENDVWKLIFNGTLIANIAQNATSSPLTSFDFALHTADPGGAGTMVTNEIAYTSYARHSVTRDTGGFTISGNSASPVADIVFPAGTGGSGTATFFSCGPTGGGATKIIISGTVTPNIVCGNGITPILTVASAFTIT